MLARAAAPSYSGPAALENVMPCPRRLFLSTLTLPLLAQAAEEVTLYAYHLKVPYMHHLGHQEGLYFDLAELLTLRIPGLRFRVQYLPRRRLEADLVAGRLNGLVVGVHPSWFKDKERTHYLWSPPLMRDADVVVSRHDKPISYSGPESLVGLRVALPRGYYYFGVDELVREGRIHREDSESEETALIMLSLGRADATITTRRTLYALLAQRPGLRGKFHVAAQPHDEYERFILIPPGQAHLHKPVSEAVLQLARDPAWQNRLLER